MRNRSWLFLALYGLLLATAVSAALKNTRPKFKIATTWTTPSTTTTSDKSNSQTDNETNESENDDGRKIEATTVAGDLNATTGHTLTGIPQIDYIWDPNLPRELNGYNLSDYPFYNSIPEEIDFKCDGLHDGFYASVPHKCQVYHHCLFGTRYDFLCANFTAFDQKTFICHFVSEVDCANSKKYWHRNDALYKAITTTTVAPPTTTTTPKPSTTTTQAPPPGFAQGPRSGPRRRRPFRRRPAYDYYDLEYYDDDYDRPRNRGSAGYDRREEYEYDDRQYSRRDNRERDRNHYRDHIRDHERDYNDKDSTRLRDYTSERSAVKDDQDSASVMRPRDRFPNRNNRRDPPRQEDPVDNERGSDARHYQDQRFVRDDYDEEQEPSAPANDATRLVKPAAPSSSVYARPRTPPKIRRPVPLSEQDRFAYKATTTIQSIADESHRRPTTEAPPTVARDPDYYYDDQLEDIRPRRPLRRRPYRERERFGYEDHPRDMRDRERDRPYRSRFRADEDEEEVRPRKYPERQRDRNRFYERNRDRALTDLEKEHPVIPERERDYRPAAATPPRRPSNRDKENDRPPLSQSPIIRDTPDETQDIPTSYFKPTTSASKDLDPIPSKSLQNNNKQHDNHDNTNNNNSNDSNLQKNNHEKEPATNSQVDDVYLHEDEYYDESEYSSSPTSSSSSTSPSSPPKTAVRIIKRPFLPSRGGFPNPRGLSTVGIKAPQANKKYNNPSIPEAKINESSNKNEAREPVKGTEDVRENVSKPPAQEAEVFDGYKAIDEGNKHKKLELDQSFRRPSVPEPSVLKNKEPDFNSRLNPGTASGNEAWRVTEDESEPKPAVPWTGEELRQRRPPPVSLQNRGNRYSPAENNNNINNHTNYGQSYASEQNRKEITGPSNLVSKQKINHVPHRLQDIPESEYDVTLNEALTPAFNQDSNSPSGFVLPYNHQNRQQLTRDPVLEPSENNYRVSRPYTAQVDQIHQQQQQQHHHQPHHQQQQQQQQQQHQHQQHQKNFGVTNAQFFPPRVNNDDRTGSVQYFKTPEVVHIAGSGYNRQSGRNSWHDYVGY